MAIPPGRSGLSGSGIPLRSQGLKGGSVLQPLEMQRRATLPLAMEENIRNRDGKGIVAYPSSDIHPYSSPHSIHMGRFQTYKRTFPAKCRGLPWGPSGGKGGSPRRKKRAKFLWRVVSRHLRTRPTCTCAHQRSRLDRNRSRTAPWRHDTSAIDLVSRESDGVEDETWATREIQEKPVAR